MEKTTIVTLLRDGGTVSLVCTVPVVRNAQEIRGKEEREGRREKRYGLIGSNYKKNEENRKP